MIRVYFLPVRIIDGAEQIAGIEFIHDALLECTEVPDIRKLIQDTTEAEHAGLVTAGGKAHPATPEEVDRYHAEVIILPPDPDVIRAKELLTTSPAVITPPEMWELLRIIGRRFGWC